MTTAQKENEAAVRTPSLHELYCSMSEAAVAYAVLAARQSLGERAAYREFRKALTRLEKATGSELQVRNPLEDCKCSKVV